MCTIASKEQCLTGSGHVMLLAWPSFLCIVISKTVWFNNIRTWGTKAFRMIIFIRCLKVVKTSLSKFELLPFLDFCVVVVVAIFYCFVLRKIFPSETTVHNYMIVGMIVDVGILHKMTVRNFYL